MKNFLQNALAVAVCALVATSHAGDLQDVQRQLDAGKFQEARALLEPMVAAGDSAAEVQLGVIYEYGLGVAKNLERAEQLYGKAAAAGNEDAQRRLRDLTVRSSLRREDETRVAQDAQFEARPGRLAAGLGSFATELSGRLAAQQNPTLALANLARQGNDTQVIDHSASWSSMSEQERGSFARQLDTMCKSECQKYTVAANSSIRATYEAAACYTACFANNVPADYPGLNELKAKAREAYNQAKAFGSNAAIFLH